ncbi:hypothetical protein [Brevundimonas sp.]|uniref:hypothetical protein n=1 Tax=Brevundimonas sp. TaxID=1871086 RepID=UPI002FC58967
MSVINRKAEFERHLWDHAADAFQAQFDERRSLTEEETDFLALVYRAAIIADDVDALKKLRIVISARANGLALVLQICGLTRNKILVDLRASAEVKKQGVKLPSAFHNLVNAEPWRAAGPYLLSRLRTVVGNVSPSGNSLAGVFEALNQSTWPGYIRQERAKRSGHEAEYRIATLLASLEVPFEPFEKADNPLCRDAQIDSISFDIVVPGTASPAIVVKSTVHTANIGQYGESKDHLEISEAREWIEKRFAGEDAPVLLAFIDGVGFRSNRAGLEGVLSKADEFCQFKTIWKVAMISASKLGLPLEIALSEEHRKEFSGFIEHWQLEQSVRLISSLETTVGWIEAGDALIRRTAT